MIETAIPMREKQFNIRFSSDETARLDEVAEHHGLNAASVFRMLLKQEHDRVRLLKQIHAEPFRLAPAHMSVLRFLANYGEDPELRESLRVQFPAPDYNVPRILNQLRENGYVRRLTTGYVLTAKGKALGE